MIDFTTLQGLTIPEGVVTQITDESGRVIWAVANDKPIVLEVEKITSDTYAGETTYTGEQFILLDIYPKTNGTVNITYGGLTKTITDTSGAAEPNAQQVFFGTFNGVTDSVATPASGELTIEGDYYAFGCGEYSVTSKDIESPGCWCVTAIKSMGNPSVIPSSAFGTVLNGGCGKITTIEIPDSVKTIETYAFVECFGLEEVSIGKGVISIGSRAFDTVGDREASSAPLTVKMMGESPPQLKAPSGSYENFGIPTNEYFSLKQIIVPKGCGDTYKTTAGWSIYADYIVEAS